MSNVSRLAVTYATAIFELADEQGQLDAVNGELSFVAHTISEYPDLAKLLSHPLVSSTDKLDTLLALTREASPLTRNFFKVVVGKGRASELSAIAVAYRHLLDARYKRVVAQVTTAVTMDDETSHLLQAQLSHYLAQDVTLETRLDPSILGGVVVRVGDRLIDGSVKGRLNELAMSLN